MIEKNEKMAKEEENEDCHSLKVKHNTNNMKTYTQDQTNSSIHTSSEHVQKLFIVRGNVTILQKQNIKLFFLLKTSFRI